MAIKAVFYFDGNDVLIHEDETKEVRHNFRPGMYKAFYHREKLTVKELNFNEKFNPHYSVNTATILDYIDKFSKDSIRKEINDMGFIHKLGIFMYGTHGTGKSSIINYISDNMIQDRDAIVLSIERREFIEPTIELCRMIREIQDNPIVVLLDEIDEYAMDYEGTLKSFLDGQRSVDNCVFLAASNYITRVPKTLLRPSRFKVVVEIKGIEDVKVIKDIVRPLFEKSNLKLTSEEIDQFCIDIKGRTLDEINTRVLDRVMDIRLDVNVKSIGFSKSIEKNEEDYEKFKEHVERIKQEEITGSYDNEDWEAEEWVGNEEQVARLKRLGNQAMKEGVVSGEFKDRTLTSEDHMKGETRGDVGSIMAAHEGAGSESLKVGVVRVVDLKSGKAFKLDLS
jgi:hypothetical protein